MTLQIDSNLGEYCYFLTQGFSPGLNERICQLGFLMSFDHYRKAPESYFDSLLTKVHRYKRRTFMYLGGRIDHLKQGEMDIAYINHVSRELTGRDYFKVVRSAPVSSLPQTELLTSVDTTSDKNEITAKDLTGDTLVQRMIAAELNLEEFQSVEIELIHGEALNTKSQQQEVLYRYLVGVRDLFECWFEANFNRSLPEIVDKFTVSSTILLPDDATSYSSDEDVRFADSRSNGEKDLQPTKRNLYIHDLDSLTLSIPVENRSRTKIPVALTGENGALWTNPMEISQTDASFLYYLAMERQAKETYWLSDPRKHGKVLFKINNIFELPPYFSAEMISQPHKSESWIWDFKNKKRRFIKKRIQERLHLHGLVQGDLIVSLTAKDPARWGNYSLAASITNIIIERI